MPRNECLLRSEAAQRKAPSANSFSPSFSEALLPEGAAEYLSYDNPRLLELKERYRNHPAASHSQWTEAFLRANLDLQHFRGDNAYLYQVSVATPAQYLIATYCLKATDSLGLFKILTDEHCLATTYSRSAMVRSRAGT